MSEQQELVNVLTNTRNKAINNINHATSWIIINDNLLQIYGIIVHKPEKYTPEQKAKHFKDLIFKMLYMPIGNYVKPLLVKETPVIKKRSWLNKVLRRM